MVKKRIYFNLLVPGVLRAAMNHRGGLRRPNLTIHELRRELNS